MLNLGVLSEISHMKLSIHCTSNMVHIFGKAIWIQTDLCIMLSLTEFCTKSAYKRIMVPNNSITLQESALHSRAMTQWRLNSLSVPFSMKRHDRLILTAHCSTSARTYQRLLEKHFEWFPRRVREIASRLQFKTGSQYTGFYHASNCWYQMISGKQCAVV